MSEELKSCPCCGSVAEVSSVYNDDNGVREYKIFCESCDLATEWDKNEKKIIKTWNARLVEDVLLAENKRLEAEYRTCRRVVACFIDLIDGFGNPELLKAGKHIMATLGAEKIP